MPALYTSQVFPGGQQKTLTISPTAGNVVTYVSPTVGLRWVIERGILTLVCGVAVADRQISLYIDDGVNTTDFGVGGGIIVASGTGLLGLTKIAGVGAGATFNVNAMIFLRDVILSNVDRLVIYIVNGAAGDSYSGFVTLREMAVD